MVEFDPGKGVKYLVDEYTAKMADAFARQHGLFEEAFDWVPISGPVLRWRSVCTVERGDWTFWKTHVAMVI